MLLFENVNHAAFIKTLLTRTYDLIANLDYLDSTLVEKITYKPVSYVFYKENYILAYE